MMFVRDCKNVWSSLVIVLLMMLKNVWFQVAREDKLPKKICDDCVYKVELLYQFWNTTASAEKQLLQWLGDVSLDDKQGYVTGTHDQVGIFAYCLLLVLIFPTRFNANWVRSKKKNIYIVEEKKKKECWLPVFCRWRIFLSLFILTTRRTSVHIE